MKSILAFLLTIQVKNFQAPVLKQLLAQIQIKPLDWSAVQRKLDEILTANPELGETYNRFKALLEKQDIALPKINLNGKVLTRSADPGKPDKETMEITNIAVVILKDNNPPEKSKELLGDLCSELETKQRSE